MWVLASDVVLVPFEQLQNGLLDAGAHDPSDCAIVQLARGGEARVVTETAADLLRQFRVPRSLEDAVGAFCRESGALVDDIVDQVQPIIAELEAAGVLVRAAEDERRATSASGAAERLLEHTVARIADVDAGADPTDAIGIAYALRRIGIARHDPSLVCAADRWIDRAAEGVGEISSPLAGVAPVHYVRALISDTLGDERTKHDALERLIAAARTRPDELSVHTGTLLGCCRALDAHPGASDRAALCALGDELVDTLGRQLGSRGPIGDAAPLSFGIAHGWAGMLYAMLAWCAGTGRAVPVAVLDRLDQLAAYAERAGRGTRWEWRSSVPVPRWLFRCTPGWCNGSAGLAQLWILAFRVTGRDPLRALAESTAWNTWDERWTNSTLCCGLAGQAYALVDMYNHTQCADWLARARALSELAATRMIAARNHSSPFHAIDRVVPDSLYRGDVGVALLAAELADPRHARMPLFQAD